MQKVLFVILFLLISSVSFSQIEKKIDALKSRGYSQDDIQNYRDSIDASNREITINIEGDTKYTDYKVFNIQKDTTFVDTTLSLKKEYQFNYIRKDDFELLAFHNQGQTYNKLAYNFDDFSLYPSIGAKTKHYNFYQIEDIKYYEVPTPTSELMYRTGLEQGQVLDALITMNVSKQFNVSLAYKGLRSLGRYRNALSSHGNFRTTFNYNSKNNRYFLKGHYVSQDLTNNENGGLTDLSLAYFEENNPNFTQRSRLETNFTDADNYLVSKRYFLNQNYKLGFKKDSTKLRSNLVLGHQFSYETKHYEFNQSSENSYFGDAFESPINDHAKYKKMHNELSAELESPYILGTIKAAVASFNFNYGFNSIATIDNQVIDEKLKGNALSVGASWKAKLKNIYVNASINDIISGDITGNILDASAMYKKDSVFELKATISSKSKSPDFNYLLYQSDYKNYNWQNNFSNEDIQQMQFEFNSKWGNTSASISQIDNYTYFDETSKPQQSASVVNYLKIKINKEIKLGKFALDNTVMYQNVSKGDDVFRVPDFVTRNTFYFSDYLFKGKPLYLQTGITFKYFTKFMSNAYDPLLSEFVLQNETEIGNFPMLDFFLNGQIRRTRLYLKVENFGARFTGRNYYSAPTYPYRDLTFRFGLVWNFFI